MACVSLFEVALQTQDRAGEFSRSTAGLDNEELRKSEEIGLHSLGYVWGLTT